VICGSLWQGTIDACGASGNHMIVNAVDCSL